MYIGVLGSGRGFWGFRVFGLGLQALEAIARVEAT